MEGMKELIDHRSTTPKLGIKELPLTPMCKLLYNDGRHKELYFLGNFHVPQLGKDNTTKER